MKIIAPPAIAQLCQFWGQRPAAEQRALRLLALVIVLALAAQTLWHLLAQRDRLQQQLPELAEQAAQAGSLANMAGRATTSEASSPGQPAPTTAVLASAKTLGGTLDVRPGDNAIFLKGDIEPGHWLRWLATLETQQRWQLVRMRAKRSTATVLNIDAELRPASRAP